MFAGLREVWFRDAPVIAYHGFVKPFPPKAPFFRAAATPVSGLRRHIVFVLGDQLDLDAAGFDGFRPTEDLVLMAEVDEESRHVWSSKQRIALFLSAMRHFAQALQARGWPIAYWPIDHPENPGRLQDVLVAAVARYQPQAVILTAPGDWRVYAAIKEAVAQTRCRLDIREDRHFFSSVQAFSAFTRERKQLRLEYWYRQLRSRENILMRDGAPEGGAWNFDAENRGSFGKNGPGPVPAPTRFAPDAVTEEVIALVNQRFKDHPGMVSASSEGFGWPVTREEALTCLQRFVKERLPLFGQYQDAMWTDEPWLYHAHLSSSLNQKLLSAREVVDAAVLAYREGAAPLPAVEGFVRQVLGWREYVRGIYWTQMPEYASRNALDAQAPLPGFFWTGKTEMRCLSQVIGQTLQTGYAHHIQRLMVTGLYCLLLGVRPEEVHAWYLSVYVDAVEWVELPNTLGMSQYADGGVMASKPYAASGKYIARMSNYCKGCRFNPAESLGSKACPFTTLYWDFLDRHAPVLAKNPRMVMQIKNLSRLPAEVRAEIRAQAQAHRRACTA
jgi:deoxyribodipyrimidine photolyase-related protein